MKITSKIEGYDTMSAEEKLKALEEFEMEEKEPDYSGYISKDTFDKTASELAKLKKEYKAKLTEDEQRAIEEKEAKLRMEEELAGLKREKALAEHKARFLSNGYSEDLATSSAMALLDGDFDTFFKNQATYQADLEKKYKSDMMAKTPYPKGGSGNHDIMTKENFKKLSFADRDKWRTEHPEEYKLLYGG
jgi:hypothetical protein